MWIRISCKSLLFYVKNTIFRVTQVFLCDPDAIGKFFIILGKVCSVEKEYFGKVLAYTIVKRSYSFKREIKMEIQLFFQL